MDHPFRTAAFGGFHRQDVLTYLEEHTRQAAQQREDLEGRLSQAAQREEELRREAEELYRAFGKAWTKFPETWKLYLLSSHTEFERTFGKTADRKRKLYNGMLKCDLFLYGVK